MNCLEYRRQLTIDPRSKREDLLAHARICDACAAFSDRLLKLEAQLEQTLDIDPPAELASRILLRQTTEVSGRQFQNRYLALAAGITLVVGLTLGWFMSSTTPTIDQVVLQHINDEADHLDEDHQVGPQKLASVLGTIGGKVLQPLGKVRYAGNCPVGNHNAAHVIIEGKQGPVTVLIMPGEYVRTRRTIGDRRFKGLIVPLEHGSIAIVGERREDVNVLEGQIISRLQLFS